MDRNTRIAVPCSPEVYDAVSFIAKATGVSRGRFLADVLGGAEGSIMAIAGALRAAEAMTQDERQNMLEAMGKVEAVLGSALSEFGQSIGGAPASVCGAKAPCAGAGDPPILTGGSTRGVGGVRNAV